MKKFNSWPMILRVAFYLGVNYLLIMVTQILGGFLHTNAAIVFNAILCLLLLLFTWVILKLEAQSFKDIGVDWRRGWAQLCAGFFIGITMLLLVALSMKAITGFRWARNPAFDLKTISIAFVAYFLSVFVQELAFRGYPFKLLLTTWGKWPAQVIMAVLFGCMHLNEGMTLRDVSITILNTGAGALLFGMTVIYTGRLHLAVGLHFGWNYMQFLIPRHPSLNGDGLLLVQGGHFSDNFFAWGAPYLVVMLIAYVCINAYLKWRLGKFRQHKGK